MDGRGLCGITLTPPRKPLVAAVDGHALAGGLELVLACDLVVASRGAMFGVPEVKRALFAAGGGALLLPRRVPILAPATVAARAAAGRSRRVAGVGQLEPEAA